MLYASLGLVLLLAATLGGWRYWRSIDADNTSAAAGAWDGEYFPNVPLVDQDGRKVRFFDDLIEGKVVLVNFIFTGCGDSCPLETARLRQVQKLLGERVGQEVFFYSISIDPINDTPETLKHYMQKFNVAPGWRFLTGSIDDVNLLRERLGLIAANEDPGKLSAHALSVVIGNQNTNQWMKVSPFENPYILADKLGNNLQNWKNVNTSGNDYASAPQIRPPSPGEQLFRTRCNSCHTLGPAEGGLADMRNLGPDLLGVTRTRDRAWLKRWIREPDRMLAEKDPLAMQLYARYDKVAMPNLLLGDGDIEALLTYMEEETLRLQPQASLAPRAEKVGTAN
ncbi:SCO family protein [Pseudomonas sp. Milli4]|uniref:SCO family protein n=2 Tax=Pseudomonas schmalbachii TaxID=2816993 RepID=A0ABS3TWI8_9PSED|nr:SCO family protein [Pseudomonas schmalbachii]